MLMNGIEERRRTTRLIIDTPVRLSDKKQTISVGKIKNLSATGALLEIQGDVLPGKTYSLSIKLEGDNSNLIIDKLLGTVVRNNQKIVAIEFDENMEWLTLFYVYRQKLQLDQE